MRSVNVHYTGYSGCRLRNGGKLKDKKKEVEFKGMRCNDGENRLELCYNCVLPGELMKRIG